MALVQPERNRTDGESKYNVPKEVYPHEFYPPYARGMAYGLSAQPSQAAPFRRK